MRRTLMNYGALVILTPFVVGAEPFEELKQPTEPLPGIEVVHDDRARTTFYFPRFDQWPQPELMIYPAIARSDGGLRTVELRMSIKDVRMHSMDSFELWVEGDRVRLPLDQKDAVTFDASGCRSVTKVNLGQQEALVRRVASSQQVEITYGKRTMKHYQLDKDDLGRFKRMVALLDAKELPPPATAIPDANVKDGVVTGSGAEKASPPKLIPMSRNAPMYPQSALKSVNRRNGRVVLSAHIEKDGTVGNVRVLRAAGGDCGFEESSIAAVKQWRYEPATRNGEPIDMDWTIVVDFAMHQTEPETSGRAPRDQGVRRMPQAVMTDPAPGREGLPIIPETWRTRLLRWGFNIFPAYWGTGGRITSIAPDWHEVRVRVPLSWRTRNYVGTIFGGSLYGAVDPIYMVMLINCSVPTTSSGTRRQPFVFGNPAGRRCMHGS